MATRLPFFSYHQQIYRLNQQIRPLVPNSERIFDLDSLLWAEQVRWNLNALTPHLKPGMRGLDVGCGKGHVAALLQRLGMKMDGIDLPVTIGEPMWISDAEWQKPIWDMIHKQDGPVFQFGDARELPYKDDTFDFITAYAVIEHITPRTDIPKFVKELHRVLKPGGFLLIADCPRRLSYSEKLAGSLGLGQHDHKFDEDEVADLVGAKFKIVDKTVYDMLPSHPPGRLLFALYNLLFPITETFDFLLRLTPLKRYAHHTRLVAAKAE